MTALLFTLILTFPGLWLSGKLPASVAFRSWSIFTFSWGLYGIVILLAVLTGWFEQGSVSVGKKKTGRDEKRRFFKVITGLVVAVFKMIPRLLAVGVSLYLVREGWLGWKTFSSVSIQTSSASGGVLAGSLFLLTVNAFVFLVFSRYTRSLEIDDRHRYLKVFTYPSLGVTWGAVAVIASILFSMRNYGKPEIWVGKAECFLMLLWGVEGILSAVWAALMPGPIEGTETRSPRSLVPNKVFSVLFRRVNPLKGFSEVLDEEMGINVSGTWSYQLLKRAAFPLFLFGVFILMLCSMFLTVKPGQEAVVERWGKPIGTGVLYPGFHFKAPWPIDKSRIVFTEREHLTHIGYEKDLGGPVLMWDQKHYEGEQAFLLGGGNELVTIGMTIMYRISNLRDFLYQHAEPEQAMLQGAYELILAETSRNTIGDFLTKSRGAMAARIQDGLQKKVDELHLGMEITFVGFKDIHPPVDVAGAFQNVVSAMEEKDAIIRRAKVETEKMIPAAEARAARLIADAKGEAAVRVARANGESTRFLSRITGYRFSPETYRVRVYMENLEELLKVPDKVIIDSEIASGDYYIDLRSYSGQKRRGID